MIITKIKKEYKNYISKKHIEDISLRSLSLLHGNREIDLSILISNNDELQNLNNLYRDIDKPTDVLSFESNIIDPETGKYFLGDIAISFEKAEEQANFANHPVINEISLLLIHGILHLSGYDHQDEDQKKEMWSKQEELLNMMNIKINSLSGDNQFHD